MPLPSCPLYPRPQASNALPSSATITVWHPPHATAITSRLLAGVTTVVRISPKFVSRCQTYPYRVTADATIQGWAVPLGTMSFMDTAAWREAGASWRQRASATFSQIPAFPTLNYAKSADEDDEHADYISQAQDSASVAHCPTAQRPRSASATRRSSWGDVRTSSSGARPRSLDSTTSSTGRQERARDSGFSSSSLLLATGATLPFTGSWSSNAFPSVSGLGVKVPRFPTLGSSKGGPDERSESAGRRNKMPLAWALSDRLASQFWERKWASQNGSTDSRGKLRVLILMSETGGGHKASATSLADALEV